jgi:hypothetical protein
MLFNRNAMTGHHKCIVATVINFLFQLPASTTAPAARKVFHERPPKHI